MPYTLARPGSPPPASPAPPSRPTRPPQATHSHTPTSSHPFHHLARPPAPSPTHPPTTCHPTHPPTLPAPLTRPPTRPIYPTPKHHSRTQPPRPPPPPEPRNLKDRGASSANEDSRPNFPELDLTSHLLPSPFHCSECRYTFWRVFAMYQSPLQTGISRVCGAFLHRVQTRNHKRLVRGSLFHQWISTHSRLRFLR